MYSRTGHPLQQRRRVLEWAIKGYRAYFKAVRNLAEQAWQLLCCCLLDILRDLLVELRNFVLLASHVSERVFYQLLQLLLASVFQLVHALMR